MRKVNKSSFDSVTRALNSVADGIPSHKVKLVVHALAGAGLLEHLNLGDVKILDLPITKKNALVIDLPRFKPRPPFGGKTSRTWALIHGTSVTAAQCILEGLIRPADWTYNPDLKQSQLPTFGAYALGMEIARADNKVPQRAAIDLLDRASEKEKGQLPVLIGALYPNDQVRQFPA